ncbi:hypothetical protein MCEMKE14_00123 [Candidatus Nanopelagicaceae bacterium]
MQNRSQSKILTLKLDDSEFTRLVSASLAALSYRTERLGVNTKKVRRFPRRKLSVRLLREIIINIKVKLRPLLALIYRHTLMNIPFLDERFRSYWRQRPAIRPIPVGLESESEHDSSEKIILSLDLKTELEVKKSELSETTVVLVARDYENLRLKINSTQGYADIFLICESSLLKAKRNAVEKSSIENEDFEELVIFEYSPGFWSYHIEHGPQNTSFRKSMIIISDSCEIFGSGSIDSFMLADAALDLGFSTLKIYSESLSQENNIEFLLSGVLFQLRSSEVLYSSTSLALSSLFFEASAIIDTTERRNLFIKFGSKALGIPYFHDNFQKHSRSNFFAFNFIEYLKTIESFKFYVKPESVDFFDMEKKWQESIFHEINRPQN